MKFTTSSMEFSFGGAKKLSESFKVFVLHFSAPKPGGPFSLYCESCKCWVPNTANAEMRKEGLYAHSHWCKDGLCDMRNGEIKDTAFLRVKTLLRLNNNAG